MAQKIHKKVVDITSFFHPGDSLHISPLERSYKAKVLMHFPSNVDWNPFDEDAVRMVSLLSDKSQKVNFSLIC